MSLRAAEVILSDAADDATALLGASKQKEHPSVLRRVDYYRQRLLDDCLEGEVIPCPLKPKARRALEPRHGAIENLYCLDLPAFWRMLYTIVRADGKPYAYVLEIVDHPTYSKWF